MKALIERPEKPYELFNKAEVLPASSNGHASVGIRATSHDPARTTFELSGTVPFGETREQTGR